MTEEEDPAVDEAPAEENVEEMPQKTVEQELQECQEKYLRLLAESENTRKRIQKERQELTKYAVENLLVEFLHPFDNFGKALTFAEEMSEEVKNWAVGFEMILSQLKQVLSQHGVEGYTSVGKPFDPHWHEAVEMTESDEHAPGTIIEEFVSGYKIGDRPIRVARVRVSKNKGDQSDDREEK